MRKSWIGCVGIVGLAATLGAALLFGAALGRFWRVENATAWVLRLPAHLTPDHEGAVLLVSVRDACAYVSIGSYRRELSDRLLGAPPRHNACTPFFPKGSTRR